MLSQDILSPVFDHFLHSPVQVGYLSFKISGHDSINRTLHDIFEELFGLPEFFLQAFSPGEVLNNLHKTCGFARGILNGRNRRMNRKAVTVFPDPIHVQFADAFCPCPF